MARTAAELANGARITDYMSLGVVTKTYGMDRIRKILAEEGRESIRERALPAHVVMYYCIALALYMEVSCREVLRCLLEGLQWLSASGEGVQVRVQASRDSRRTRGISPHNDDSGSREGAG